jgi:signal transduction histidine kinase
MGLLVLSIVVTLLLTTLCLILWRAGIARVEAEKARAEEEIRRVEAELARVKLAVDAVVGREMRRIAHDIKSILGAILLGAEMLFEAGCDLSEPDIVDTSSGIRDCAERLQALVDSVGSPDVARDVELASAIQTATMLCGLGEPFVITVPHGQLVSCVPLALGRLLSNLVSNAVRHKVRDSLISVSPVSNGGLGFRVSNEVAGPIDCDAVWASEDSLGMSNIRELSASLGVDTVINCEFVGGKWIFNAIVIWRK